jgi:hypothetical protein
VTFSVTTGGGQVGPQPVLTDSQGYATTTFMPSLTDTTNPVVTAASLGASSATFNLVWRGLSIDYQPATSTVTILVKHSQTLAPISLVFDTPPAPTALAWTPWGLVWTSILAPASGMLALDGLALVGPPTPGMVTGAVAPTWTATVPNLPPLGGLSILGQAYGIDTSRLPAQDAYFVSNPVTVTLN